MIFCKVLIFWEGHKILWNLHQLFDWQYIGQIISGDIVYVPCDDDIDDVHEDFSTPTSEYCQIQGFVNADRIFAMQAGTTSTASIPSFSRITKNALSDLVTAYKLLYFTYMGNAFSINSLF